MSIAASFKKVKKRLANKLEPPSPVIHGSTSIDMPNDQLADYTKNDIKKAERLLKEQRKNIEPLPELESTCVISILIPVYDESLTRLKTQIRFFNLQRLDKSLYEIVYIVNNPPSTKTNISILKKNARAIRYLKKIASKNIHLIDRSSVNHELVFGNVGEARNIGLHSISKRYFEQKRDGIIIHTDADTFPEDVRYLEKVKEAFEKPRVYGAAGGTKFILSLDNDTKNNRDFFEANLPLLHKYMRWNFLLSALNSSDAKLKFEPTTFSGAHMISRAIASVCVGGIKQVNRGEDYLFGEALLRFAKNHHGQIYEMRDKWIFTTSLRESNRSGTSFGPIFRHIKATNGRPMVRAITTPFFPIFAKDLIAKIAKLPMQQQEINSRHFFNIKLKISENELLALKELQLHLQKVKNTSKYYDIYEKIRAEDPHTILHKLFNKVYKITYPKVRLDDKALSSLQKQVFSNPNKKAYALNAIKYYGTFHLK